MFDKHGNFCVLRLEEVSAHFRRPRKTLTD